MLTADKYAAFKSRILMDSGRLNLLGIYGSVPAFMFYDQQSGTNSLKIAGKEAEQSEKMRAFGSVTA